MSLQDDLTVSDTKPGPEFAVLLPGELWLSVFSHDLSEQDLHQLSLTCKVFYYLAQPLFFASVTLWPSWTSDLASMMQTRGEQAQDSLFVSQVEHITSSRIASRIRRLLFKWPGPTPATLSSAAHGRANGDALELLQDRAHLLRNITHVYFGNIPVPFKFLESLCGVNRTERMPLDELVIDHSKIAPQDSCHPPQEVRVGRVYASGEIEGNPGALHSLLHSTAIHFINLSLSDAQNTSLLSGGRPFPHLTRLELITAGAIPLASLREVLPLAPALEILGLSTVELEDLMVVPHITPDGVCPLIHTLAAQIHAIQSLSPGRPVRRVCLLGLPQMYGRSREFTFAGTLGQWFNAGHELTSQLQTVLHVPWPEVEKLHFLARDFDVNLMLFIWDIFPGLKLLDIRLPEGTEETQYYFCNFEALSFALMAPQAHVPETLQRLTVHGVELKFDEDEDDDSLGSFESEVGGFRQTVCEYFQEQPEFHLRHVEFISLDTEECLVFNPQEPSATVDVTEVEDWVPHAKFINKRDKAHLGACSRWISSQRSIPGR